MPHDPESAEPPFRSLLDARIVVAERRIEATGDDAERRAREFSAGRELSRHLMRQLATRGTVRRSVPDRLVGRGPHGEPLFPRGVVGSITHSAGVVAAAVAATRMGVLSIGVDVQPAAAFSAELADFVGSAGELDSAPGLAAQGLAPTVLFSAKESVFKAWFSLTGRWLEFDDVAVRLHDDGRFLIVDPVAPGHWRGRWRVSGDGVVRSAAVISE